jgi:predicted aspartyl protease
MTMPSLNSVIQRQSLGALRMVCLIALALVLDYRADGFGSRVTGDFQPSGSPAVDSADTCGQQSLFEATKQDTSIPFELENGFLVVVQGRIGTLKALKFVLDTGATHTIIDASVAEKLDLSRQAGTFLSFDRRIKIDWTTIPEFQVGPLTAQNLRAMVGPLRDFSDFSGTVDGIIGLDFLGLSQSLRIDFASKLLQFRTRASSDFVETAGTLAPIVHLQVQGQRVALILDTGVRNIVLFKERLHQNLPNLKFATSVVPTSEGRLRGGTAGLPGIRVGLNELQVPVFLISKAPSSLPAEIDGFLGARAFNSTIVEVNFEAGVLRRTEPQPSRVAASGGSTPLSQDRDATAIVPRY